MPRKPINAIAVVAVLATGAIAVAADVSSTDAQQASLPGEPGCFYVRNVRGWTVLDDSTLIVHAPLTRNAYLVKLFRPVQSLGLYLRVGFTDVDRTGRVCNNSKNYLIVREYTPPRIPIVAVRELTMPEQAQLLTSAGKGMVTHDVRK